MPQPGLDGVSAIGTQDLLGPLQIQAKRDASLHPIEPLAPWP